MSLCPTDDYIASQAGELRECAARVCSKSALERVAGLRELITLLNFPDDDNSPCDFQVSGCNAIAFCYCCF